MKGEPRLYSVTNDLNADCNTGVVSPALFWHQIALLKNVYKVNVLADSAEAARPNSQLTRPNASKIFCGFSKI